MTMLYYPPGAMPRRCSTGHIVVAWVLAVFSFLYLLPWAIAASRHKQDVATVAVVNLLLGWTLIGWVVAFVLSVLPDRTPAAIVIPAPAPVQAPAREPNAWRPLPSYPRPAVGPRPGYAGPASQPTAPLPEHAPTVPLPSLYGPPPSAPAPRDRPRDGAGTWG